LLFLVLLAFLGERVGVFLAGVLVVSLLPLDRDGLRGAAGWVSGNRLWESTNSYYKRIYMYM